MAGCAIDDKASAFPLSATWWGVWGDERKKKHFFFSRIQIDVDSDRVNQIRMCQNEQKRFFICMCIKVQMVFQLLFRSDLISANAYSLFLIPQITYHQCSPIISEFSVRRVLCDEKKKCSVEWCVHWIDSKIYISICDFMTFWV